MDTSIIVACIAPIASLGGVALGTYLNRRASIATAKELAKLDHRKAIKDRLWDHQREAYSAMIASVRSVRSQAGTLAHAYDRGDTGSGFEKARDEFWEDWVAATAQFHAGRLIFSHSFHDRYQAFINVINDGKPDYGEVYDNYFEWFGEYAGPTFSDLVEIARRDIGTDSPSV